MGEGGSNGGDGSRGDPFVDLHFGGTAPHEPSAGERARSAARRSRQLDLQRRLAEEAEHERRFAQRDRRASRKLGRQAGPKKWAFRAASSRSVIAPVLVIAVVAGLYWLSSQQGSGGFLAGPAPTVARPASFPPVDDEVAEEPLGVPPAAPSDAGAYEFLTTQDSGDEPVAWDPCRPIRFVVNTTHAPPGADALLDDAIARTSAATGLVFENEGDTSETWTKEREPYQPERYGERWAPVLIHWSTAEEVPGIAGYIAGLAGGTPRSLPSDPTQPAAYVSGQVVLDGPDLASALAFPGGADGARAVIQHELGHLVGLDHVNDASQLMYSEGSEAQAGDWGTGDLAGLQALGSGDCFPGL